MVMPVIIIHSLDDAVAALSVNAQAATDVSTPLYLISPPGAAASLGAAVFQSIIDEARNRVPEQPFIGVLDCGSDPGYALAALRAGVKHILYCGTAPSKLKIENIARANKCCLLDLNDIA